MEVQDDLLEKVVNAYRSAWLESANQALVLRAQLDLINDKYMQSTKRVEQLENQIEVLKTHNKPSQANKEQK